MNHSPCFSYLVIHVHIHIPPYPHIQNSTYPKIHISKKLNIHINIFISIYSKSWYCFILCSTSHCIVQKYSLQIGASRQLLGVTSGACHNVTFTTYLSLFFYTPAYWGLEILHLKVRILASRVASRQNSANYHPKTQIMICVKTMICMLNCESNYTLCKIARWVKHYTMCKISHSVKKLHSKHFLSCTP